MDLFFNIGLYHFLAGSLFLFAIGLLGVIFSKNLLKTLISAQILFCGIILNLASFAAYCDTDSYKGITLAYIITVVFAVITGAGLIITMNINKYKDSSDIEKLNELKG